MVLTRLRLQNGPAGVFPDAALWNIGSGGDGSLNPLGVSGLSCLSLASTNRVDSSQHWDFWVALVCQIIIIVGYFIFFRKEQLVRSLSCLFSHAALTHQLYPLHRASRKLLVFFSNRGTRYCIPRTCTGT